MRSRNLLIGIIVVFIAYSILGLGYSYWTDYMVIRGNANYSVRIEVISETIKEVPNDEKEISDDLDKTKQDITAGDEIDSSEEADTSKDLSLSEEANNDSNLDNQNEKELDNLSEEQVDQDMDNSGSDDQTAESDDQLLDSDIDDEINENSDSSTEDKEENEDNEDNEDYDVINDADTNSNISNNIYDNSNLNVDAGEQANIVIKEENIVPIDDSSEETNTD